MTHIINEDLYKERASTERTITARIDSYTSLSNRFDTTISS